MTALVLAASLLLSAPSVYGALRGTGSVDTALWHLGAALLACWVAARVLRAVLDGYERSSEAAAGVTASEEPDAVPAGRRRTDG